MYILDGRGMQIVNTEFVERFCVVTKPDAALIIASYSQNREPVTLARYKDDKEAKAALMEMLGALAGGQRQFVMPDSLLRHEETIKHDARTKRRGGS